MEHVCEGMLSVFGEESKQKHFSDTNVSKRWNRYHGRTLKAHVENKKEMKKVSAYFAVMLSGFLRLMLVIEILLVA
jgi:hypothetical protein